jgi:hypothetical protein
MRKCVPRRSLTVLIFFIDPTLPKFTIVFEVTMFLEFEARVDGEYLSVSLAMGKSPFGLASILPSVV